MSHSKELREDTKRIEFLEIQEVRVTETISKDVTQKRRIRSFVGNRVPSCK